MSLFLGCGAIAATALATSGTTAAGSAKVPAKDSFNGRITAATGRYAHDGDSTSLFVHHSKSSHVTVKITGRACGHRAHCLDLEGTLSGTLTRLPSNPDAGALFRLTASGKIGPLGEVSASGLANGTGFIAQGHESFRLTVTGSHGKVTLNLQSPLVPGFTSP